MSMSGSIAAWKTRLLRQQQWIEHRKSSCATYPQKDREEDLRELRNIQRIIDELQLKRVK